jgi:hypothetical protein
MFMWNYTLLETHVLPRVVCGVLVPQPHPMPLLGGIRQRLGLPCRNRSRSARGVPLAAAGVQQPEAATDPDDDFRDYIAELFISNTLPGTVTQQMFRKAGRSGAAGVDDLGRTGNSVKEK